MANNKSFAWIIIYYLIDVQYTVLYYRYGIWLILIYGFFNVCMLEDFCEIAVLLGNSAHAYGTESINYCIKDRPGLAWPPAKVS